MKILSQLLLLAISVPELCYAARQTKVLLSEVNTLTLRDGQKTAARRVTAIPQLKCIGGDAKGLYTVDVMRCKNEGSDYNDNK
jgi:hypothetical protein